MTKTPIEICLEKLVGYIKEIILIHNKFPTPETQEIIDLIKKWRKNKDE